ncbi:helix-turn-helix domain-containing protein [Clostridium botulinum]|uniref:helix-turn-helix domain-containing protein n=1 Tax=Clostridium botulinum TaxID=1491 RepID=UPI00096F550A
MISFCIENNENYQLAAAKYKVSYQQVYSWTVKYKQSGTEALVDRRGKRKTSEEVTEAEKLAAKIKLLETENKRLQMENGFLKKMY